MNLLRKGSHVFAATWLGYPLQFLTSVLVIRTLGADGRGEIVVLGTAATVLVMLGQLGTPTAAVYFARKRIFPERALLGSFLALALAECLVVSLLWLAGARWFLALFLPGAEIGRWTVALALLSVPFQLVNTFASSLLLGLGESGGFARATVGVNLLTALLTLGLVVVLPFGVPGALIAIATAQAAGAAYLVRVLLSGRPGQPWVPRWRTLAAMVGFGVRHYVGAVGAQLFKRGDNFIVAYFLGAGAVGYYSVGVIAYDAVLSIPRAVGNLLSGDAATRDARGAAEVVSRITRNVVWMMIAVAGVAGVGGIWLVPLVYGADFTTAVPPMQILLVASVLVGATIGLQSFFLAVGRPGIYGVLTIVAGAANLALSLWLVPRWGIVGNALATLVASAASAGLHLLWFRRLTRLPVREVMLLKLAEVRLGMARVRASARLARSTNS